MAFRSPITFRSDRDRRDAIDFWGWDYIQTRNKEPAFPQWTFCLETENHYAYINLQPKPEFATADGIERIGHDLERLFGNTLGYVRVVKADGVTDYLYRRPNDHPLPPDAEARSRIKVIFNARDQVSIINNKAALQSSAEFKETILGPFFKAYFNDSLGRPLEAYTLELSSSPDIRKWQLKKKQHPLYNTPHSEAATSPIEKLFQDALDKHKIPYRKQTEFRVEGQKLTVPDFFLEEQRVAIYCDGTEFHKDPDRIIKDKQQDRYLQIHGFIVLRFSGSEIKADAEGCVGEVVELLFKKR